MVRSVLRLYEPLLLRMVRRLGPILASSSPPCRSSVTGTSSDKRSIQRLPGRDRGQQNGCRQQSHCQHSRFGEQTGHHDQQKFIRHQQVIRFTRCSRKRYCCCKPPVFFIIPIRQSNSIRPELYQIDSHIQKAFRNVFAQLGKFNRLQQKHIFRQQLLL